jgi:hypothetical protein
MAKVSEIRKVLALVDELKPLIKRGVSDDKVFAICAKHLCVSADAETQKKTVETAKQ